MPVVGDTAIFVVFVALFLLIFLLDVVWVIVIIVRGVRRTRKVVALKRTGHRVIAQVTSISREFVFAPRGYGGFRFV